MRTRCLLIASAFAILALSGCGGKEEKTEPPFEGLRVLQTKFGDLDALTVENAKIRVTFVPSLGGRVAEYTLKRTGHNAFWTNPEFKPPDEVVSDAYYAWGGLDDHLNLDGSPGHPYSLTRAAYAHDVVEGDDNVTVKLTYAGKGWTLERTHVVYRDSTRLSTLEVVTNLDNAPRELAPRPHPVFAVGGAADDNDVILLPVDAAVLVQRYMKPYSRDIAYPLHAKWAAAVDTIAREAVVFTFGDKERPDGIDLWFSSDSYNLEPIAKRRMLAKGESASLRFDLFVLQGDDVPVGAKKSGLDEKILAQVMQGVQRHWEGEYYATSWGTLRPRWPGALIADNVPDDSAVEVEVECIASKLDLMTGVVRLSPVGKSSDNETIELKMKSGGGGVVADGLPWTRVREKLPVASMKDGVWNLTAEITNDNGTLCLTHPVALARKTGEEVAALQRTEKNPYKPRAAEAAFYLEQAKRRGRAIAGQLLVSSDAMQPIRADLEHVRAALDDKLPERKTGELTRFYISNIDDSAQGYRLFVPDNYARDVSWPLVVDLHGRDPSFSPFDPDSPMRYVVQARKHGCIYVMPHGRGNLGYRGAGGEDVFTVIEHVRADYNVDPERTYLTGTSMGGGGTWLLATRYPGRFAAIAPIFGLADYSLYAEDFEALGADERFRIEARGSVASAGNLIGTPVFTYHGAKDAKVSVEHTRRMVARLKELGVDVTCIEDPEGVHMRPRGLDAQIFDFLLKHRRAADPEALALKAPYLRYGKDRWITLDGFSEPGTFGEIRATRKDAQVDVEAKNVSAFTLRLPEKLAQERALVSVIVNRETTLAYRVPVTGELSFHVEDDPRTEKPLWTAGKPETDGPRDYLKDADTEGPMGDVFRKRFILVCGTKGDDEADAVCRAEAEWFARNVWRRVQHVDPIIRSDEEISAADVRDANLVLIGGPKLNRIAERIESALPVRFRAEGPVDVDGVALKPPHGALALVYPNPAYPGRCVLLLTGTSVESTKGLFSRVDFDVDYQALGENTKDLASSVLYGVFDQRWEFDRRHQHPERVGADEPGRNEEEGE